VGGTDLLERVKVHSDPAADTPWQALLWNDPVNLADVVTKVLIKVLGIDEPTAHRLMMTAHMEGKAAVYSGTQEQAQAIADKLGSFNLWATVEKAGS
jgi:ATP-dependent Clp protease adaptor protein ClpS